MTELFEEFQEFRRILCVCPCCGELVRVSDLRLKAKGPAVRTWLDDYEKKEKEIEKREVSFDEQEEGLREKAREKGRKEAKKVFNRAVCSSLKALKLDPFDVKPILNPIDFVVFKGMNKMQSVSDIILLSQEHKCPSLDIVRRQIKIAVEKTKYEWQVARIDDRGNIILE